MTGALRGDPQAVLAGEADDVHDVVRRGGQRDRGGMLVDGQVPGLAGVVPAGVAGHERVVVGQDGGMADSYGRVDSGWSRSATGAGAVLPAVLDATDGGAGANPLRTRISAAPRRGPARAPYP